MGQEWALPTVGTLAECMRVLKPGGFFLAHGGTRTYDLLTMALRMAGFLIRDSISVEGGLHRWYHGQGFAKSTKKALLRPLWEPIIHAVKPGPLRELNIDAGRVAHAGASDLEASLQRNPGRDDQASSDAYGACWPQQRVNVTGRYPPNACFLHLPATLRCAGCGAVVDDAPGSCPLCGTSSFLEVPGCTRRGAGRVPGTGPKRGGDLKFRAGRYAQDASSRQMRSKPQPGFTDAEGMETVDEWECAPGCALAALAETSGHLHGAGFAQPPQAKWSRRAVHTYGDDRPSSSRIGDAGTAARFFPQWPQSDILLTYAAKAAPSERHAGCEHLLWARDDSRPSGHRPVTRTEWETLPEEDRRQGNIHPTVKSGKLAGWILDLYARPGDVMLDLYAGSGSLVLEAHRRGIGGACAEIDPDFVTILRARVAHLERKLAGPVQLPMFG